MATRSVTLLITAFMFFLYLFPAAAETETYFVQRLSWQGDSHALRYEVIIEEEAGTETEYIILRRVFTGDTFVELSLSPGKYRYGIVPYDLLNRRGPDPVWMPFEILPALKPEIHEFYPSSFIIGRNAAHELNLSGKNLVSGMEIYLYNSDSGDNPIVPVEANFLDDGNNARFVFDYNSLVPGVYEILVKNPGGLETRTGEFEIIYHVDLWEPFEYVPLFSLIDIFLGAALSPLIHMYIEQYDMFVQTPLGIVGRLALTASEVKPINAGLEFGIFSHYFMGGAKYESSFSGFQISLLLQKRLPAQGAAFSFRAGAGHGILSGKYFKGNGRTESIYENCPYLATGLSFIWLGNKRLFLEAGFDYLYLFSNEINSAFIRPWIGFGLRY